MLSQCIQHILLKIQQYSVVLHTAYEHCPFKWSIDQLKTMHLVKVAHHFSLN